MSDSFSPQDPEAADKAVGLLKALSHAGRLRILCCLIDRDMNVGELIDALHEPQATISQQLMRLRAEGFVRPIRQGKHVVYKLVRSEVTPVIAALRDGLCRPAAACDPGQA
jgi:ArsR family transcriptional regulator, virulence genes transcriptional regulator